MNEYLFYTTEGTTFVPNMNADIENCQVLGYSKGENKVEALLNLLIENPWIKESKFDVSKIISVQILSKDAKQALQKLIDYLWEDEKRLFEESGKPTDHIFNIIEQIAKPLV